MVRKVLFGWLVAALIALVAPAVAEPWSFGVISDTQWQTSDDRADKGVAAEIIDDVNQHFIAAGVRFVVAVGDVTNNGGSRPDELDIRAKHNAALAAAGIRFFPVRGNHESTLAAAKQFGIAFPNLPGTPGFQPGDGYGDASSPDLPGLAGLSYAFSYRDATLVLIDQFTQDDGSEKGRGYPLTEQLPWLRQTLESSHAAGRHGFVFAHKNLLGQNHKDTLFGSPSGKDDPGDKEPERRALITEFIQALADHGARYYLCGHDHIYHRAVVEAPDPAVDATVQQIIAGSCSHKFYNPHPPYSAHEHPLAQQRNEVGYLIITVDGPRVTARYYSAPTGLPIGRGGSSMKTWAPGATYTLQDTFGYSANGREFLLQKGDSLRAVTDQVAAGNGFVGTALALLDGVATGCGTTLDDSAESRRQTASLVTTGWAAPTEGMASDILTLRGLQQELGSSTTEPFTVSLSYQPNRVPGQVAICSPNADGRWVNTVDLNAGGKSKQVAGVYAAGAPLGSWGVDPTTKTAWAVVDHGGEFAVMAPGP